MATEGGTGVMVDIVADEADLVEEVHLFEGLQQDRVPGPVVTKQIDQRAAFARAVFQMAHVHISPPAVDQESPVAGRPVPVPPVHVRQTDYVPYTSPIAHPADG